MVGTKWSNAQGQEFKIVSIDYSPNQVKIYYVRLSDNQEFNCFEQAFKQRFFKVESER